jgi:hypothetical protein
MKGMMFVNDFYIGGEPKTRIIQELVPGKQITLAHVIANPDKILYTKLGLDPSVDYAKSAIGILTVSPAKRRSSPRISRSNPRARSLASSTASAVRSS